jgi:hypothetical protein
MKKAIVLITLLFLGFIVERKINNTVDSEAPIVAEESIQILADSLANY